MNRVELAFRTFFWIFFRKSFAEKIEAFFEEQPQAALLEQKEPQEVQLRKPRNDAVQILALLQREGRLIDFLKEPIESYNDAQIGAAVRDVHRDCAAVLERVFEIQPLVDNDEGSCMTVVSGYDPEQFRLTGNVTGNPPYEGTVRHHGWRAAKVELPLWNGNDESVDIIAPVEVELP
ncbi:MAG TPA: DUF2760 domain-containing protein [Chitinispirillaceae bacterium]|nr:DUF2760 domain-containing protein [Chitinispirillaceae bacterium]